MSGLVTDFGNTGETALTPAKPPQAHSQAPQQYSRVSVRVPVRVSSIDPEIDPITGAPYFLNFDEVCLNLSRGGAFVSTAEGIAPGRRMLVEIEMPDGTSIQSVGQVVWSRVAVPGQEPRSSSRSGFGIEFSGGRPEEFLALEQFLDQAARRRRRSADAPAGNHTTL